MAESWEWNACGIKNNCFSVTQTNLGITKEVFTAQVAIFSPQFLYFLVYFICKRRFVFLACPAKDVFACSLAFYKKTSIKRLETFSLRLVLQLLQGLQENANQTEEHMLIRLFSTLVRSSVAHTMKTCTRSRYHFDLIEKGNFEKCIVKKARKLKT